MKALIIGATGATGKELIKELISDDRFDEIIAFVRRPIDFGNPKVKIEVIDFNQPNSWKHLIVGDVAFSCLGTTLKDAGSKQAQWKIDFDYQFEFAKAAKENSIKTFVLVSSLGANSTSKLFYPRMKGKLENAVKELNFPKLIIFKPGFLNRPETNRFGEKIALKILNFLNSLNILNSQKPLPTSVLAKAMLNSIEEKKEFKFKEITGKSIFDL